MSAPLALTRANAVAVAPLHGPAPAASTLQDRIRTLRKQAGMMQVDLGAAVGVSRGHIAGIETGKDFPGRELLSKIAGEFRVSLDWLARGQGGMQPAGEMSEREAMLLQAWRSMARDEAEALLDYMLKRAAATEQPA